MGTHAYGYLRPSSGRDRTEEHCQDIRSLLRRNGFELREVFVDDGGRAGFTELLDVVDGPEPAVVVVPSLDHLVGNQLAQLCSHGDVWTLNPERRWVR